MRVVYFYKEEWEQEFVRSRASDIDFAMYPGTTQDNPDIRDESAEVLSVFTNSQVGKSEMDRFPKLKHIATRSTGYDHIDLGEAAARGIVVSNVPMYGENTVAEFTFALLLTLSRKVYDAYKRVEQTGSFSQDGLRGFDLKGKTLGVVGGGHIGLHSARIARGFDMNVVVFDVHPNNALAEEIGFKYVGFDELLGASDVITLHVPYNPHTHHLINQGNIGKIKRGAYLINTSRGPVVETLALVKALEEGILAGAGLDVLEEEGEMVDETELLFSPHPNAEKLHSVLANHYFIDHPRVIVTPHNAFNTQEAIERILQTTAENILAFKNGTLQNIVSKS